MEQSQPAMSDLDRLVNAVEKEFQIHKRRARLLWAGIILAGVAAVLVGGHMFHLIEGMSDDMAAMAKYMATMQDRMQAMAGEGKEGNMGVMAARMMDMSTDMKSMRGNMESMSGDMRQMRGYMESVPAMQQEVGQMAETVERMQHDTGAMRWGVTGMRQDTANMGYPFRVMNTVTPW